LSNIFGTFSEVTLVCFRFDFLISLHCPNIIENSHQSLQLLYFSAVWIFGIRELRAVRFAGKLFEWRSIVPQLATTRVVA
jgi:hypothetical protein